MSFRNLASDHQLQYNRMLLIFALFLFSFCQQLSVTQAQHAKFDHDDDQPERFYVTHEAWFNVSIRDNKLSSAYTRTERIVIGLFGEICPMTVTNFITITKGLRRSSVSIENNTRNLFHCMEFYYLG
jgi:cytochrome oxidase Cu insertion factor (SCO1/SenC/PrrC family)